MRASYPPAGTPEAAASRLSYLAKRGVANLGRKDLVDAAVAGEVDVAKLPATELPAPLQALDADARKQYVESQATERKNLQERIAKLGAARDEYVRQEEEKARAAGGGDGFDAKVRAVVKEQAAKKGIR